MSGGDYLSYRGRYLKGGLFVLLMGSWLGAVSLAGTYYVAPNGSSANSGLSTNSPWPVNYAGQYVPQGSTVMVASGTYPGEFDIKVPYTTWQAQTKWGPKFVNSGNAGIYTYSAAHHVTLDGLAVSYSRGGGIWLNGSDSVVRNCWVSHSGYGNAGAQDGSGITTHWVPNTIVENCLLEYNGSSAGYDHGIYVGGANVIVRNNVVRYNYAFGIQVWDNEGYANTVSVYNNLSYGNAVGGGCPGDALIAYGESDSSGAVRIYNNTFISTRGYAMQLGDHGNFYLTNNILIGSSGPYTTYSPLQLFQGNNYIATSVSPVGFVNTSKGLYWLSATSPARGGALSAVHGPTDFFGVPLTSVQDIGAFQYSSTYAADTRTLDPSPSGGADYWQSLGGSSGSIGSGSTGSGPTTNGFTFQASAGTVTAPFSISNGYVSQTVDTENANGGQAVYTFTTSTAGVYVVSAVVNAPTDSANSFYVNIDGPLTDPYMIWDIPVTSGFESRTVSWRGNGDGNTESDEFMPKAFALPAGTHSLVIMGREPNTQLQSILIQPVGITAPSVPPVLRLLSGS